MIWEYASVSRAPSQPTQAVVDRGGPSLSLFANLWMVIREELGVRFPTTACDRISMLLALAYDAEKSQGHFDDCFAPHTPCLKPSSLLRSFNYHCARPSKAWPGLEEIDAQGKGAGAAEFRRLGGLAKRNKVVSISVWLLAPRLLMSYAPQN